MKELYYVTGHGSSDVATASAKRAGAAAQWIVRMKQEKEAAKLAFPSAVAEWDEAAKTCLAVTIIGRAIEYATPEIAIRETPLYVTSPELSYLKIHATTKDNAEWTEVALGWRDPATGREHELFSRDQRLRPLKKP